MNTQKHALGGTAAHLKPYPVYRDSGVEWLGDIPAHWDVRRLKFTAPIRNRQIRDKADDLPYIGLENIESWTGGLLLDAQPEIVDSGVVSFKAGDVLFGKLRPYLAKVGRPRFDGVCTAELVVMEPVAGCSQSHLFYSLLNPSFIAWIDSLTYGTKMPRVSPDQVSATVMPVPPLDEQRAVSAFLDRGLAGLDALVVYKERLLVCLEEKRAALIEHSVTKGLDPNVRLKDSGIEWLGDIPAHWDVKRLKHLAVLNPESLSEDTAPDFEITYIDIGEVDSFGRINGRERLTFAEAPTRARRIVRDGDIIVSTVRTYLRAIAVIREPEPSLVVSTGFAVVRPTDGFTPGYASYALRAPYFVERVVANSTGVGYPAINESELATYALAVPPESEQAAIASFLDRETNKIEAVATKVRDSIERLKEYRTALISAAVTGKIDGREEPFPDDENRDGTSLLLEK